MNRDGAAYRVGTVVAVLGLAAVAGTFRVRAYDLFWHLAGGRWILEHGALPRTDPFRFTSHDLPWYDHGWLFQVWLRSVERLGGLDALVLARSCCVVGLAAFLLWAIRRNGVGLGAAGLLVIVAVLGARPRLMLRPELASLLALPVFLSLLMRIDRKGSKYTVIAALLLVVLWANLHAGVLVAPPLAAAWLLGHRLNRLRESDRAAWLRTALLPPAFALVTLVNPAGLELWLLRGRIAAALEGLPASNPEWLPVWVSPIPALLAGAAAGWLLWLVVALRTRRPDFAVGFGGFALSALAAGSVRHQGLFFVGGAMLAAPLIAAWPAARPRLHGRASFVVVGLLCLLGAVWCVVPPASGPLRPRQSGYSFGLGLEPGRFPERAADELERRSGVGPLFNDVAFGGYLIWRLYPQRRVFIDGRNELDPGLLREVLDSGSEAGAWSTLLERYGIDAAILRYRSERWQAVRAGAAGGPPTTLGYHTPSYLRFPAERFALVHWDDAAMLFLRRTAGRARELAGTEYRFVHPEDIEASLAAAAADPEILRGARIEIARRLARDPDCRRARQIQRALENLGR